MAQRYRLDLCCKSGKWPKTCATRPDARDGRRGGIQAWARLEPSPRGCPTNRQGVTLGTSPRRRRHGVAVIAAPSRRADLPIVAHRFGIGRDVLVFHAGGSAVTTLGERTEGTGHAADREEGERDHATLATGLGR